MAKVRSVGLRVPLLQAEEARRLLQSQGLLRHDLRLITSKHHIFFPISRRPSPAPFGEIIEHAFEPRQERTPSYQDAAAIPAALKGLLPTSYDIVGAIALVKLPEELDRYALRVGEAMLKTNPHLRSVCQVEPVTGELRVRGCRVIAGAQDTVTTHLEYGVRFMVDVGSIYFSPRLSNERRRVAGCVADGERIVDLFAGVAPFSIMIAKYAHPVVVYAIDKNERAVEFARRNVVLNQVGDRVEVIQGDARDVARLVPGKVDRIIMNLPFSAHAFLGAALSVAADECILHYYDILAEEAIEARWRALTTTAAGTGFRIERDRARRLKSYSAREFYIGMDITATKEPAAVA